MFITQIKKVFALVFFLCLIGSQLDAQVITKSASSIKGVIIDRNSEALIENATIEVMDVSPRKSTVSDASGQFILDDVPIGRQRLRVNAPNYEEKVVTDVVLDAGSRITLRVQLEESIQKITKVDVTDPKPVVKHKPEEIETVSETTKDKPNNSMAGMDARPFTVEEVTRYAGARFDLARMVTNYAGAAGYDDSRNDIVIRGNSPSQILWQIEDLPVENPNHISTIGTSGGTSPILNIFALGETDFLSGSFAAQYGNALSGVFDIKLRNGDASGFGLMALVGSQRAELMIEGPLSKNQFGGSYMLSLRSATGAYVPIKIFATDPANQDFNLKITSGRKKWGE